VQYWHRQVYRIVIEDDVGSKAVQVDGIVMADTPDIGLHMGSTHYVDVTHIPTGRRIGSFATLGAGMEFVHRIAYLRDWGKRDLVITEEEAKHIRELWAAVSATEQKPFVLMPL
jgi:hypothetical protein